MVSPPPVVAQMPRGSPPLVSSVASDMDKIPSMEDSDLDFSPCSVVERRSTNPRSLKRTAQGLVIFAILVFSSQLLVGVCLRKAGITETDMTTEFLSQNVLPNLENGWARINDSISAAYLTQEKLRPGFQLAQQGATAHYPVVMVPGFITSGLELWRGEECARKHFRQRLWGSLGTARTFFTDRDCFLRHLSLDPLTGGDPEKIGLRAAQGFEAADYFMSTIWVWTKLIENLADVGYDTSSMIMMSYDWRLAFPVLEERDGYPTKLQKNIEAMHKSSGKKVVLASHSMGSLLTLYFFAWVTADEKDGGGGGGERWVDENIHAFVNIAGPLLGVPKAAPALLSGEMRDTSVLLGAFGSMVEKFFGRRRRKDLWITWGSLWAMLPKGGDDIWGSGADICNETSIFQDGFLCRHNDGAVGTKESQQDSSSKKTDIISAPFIQMTDTEDDDEGLPSSPTKGESVCKNEYLDPNVGGEKIDEMQKKIMEYSSRGALSTDATLNFLREWGGGYGTSLSSSKLHFQEKNDKPSMKTWHDPSVTPLPRAPSLKIYCLYGVGLKTERAYFYKRTTGSNEDFVDENVENAPPQCRNIAMDLPFMMDTTVQNEEHDIKNGVRFADGDGSVPVLSLGYMCMDGWKQKKYNPAGVDVITREYLHHEEFIVEDPMRGGPKSADHVDILGNSDMTEDFLRVATGFGSSGLDTQVASDIVSIARRVNSHRGKKTSLMNFLSKFR